MTKSGTLSASKRDQRSRRALIFIFSLSVVVLIIFVATTMAYALQNLHEKLSIQAYITQFTVAFFTLVVLGFYAIAYYYFKKSDSMAFQRGQNSATAILMMIISLSLIFILQIMIIS